MSTYRVFSPGDRFPADFPDALGEFLGSAVLNFQLILKPGSETTVQVPAGADNDKVAIAINGRWRYNIADVERASPGGTARAMDIHVTGSDNVFAAGGDGEVDSTDYSFALAITDAGGTPSGVDLSRKVGAAQWDGTKFISLVQTVPAVPTEIATPLVTSLPADPLDGQEVAFLADATSGVVWRLRYRAASSSAYKWEFVGGASLADQADATISIVSPVYTGSPLFDGPQVTLPLAGDYDLEYGCELHGGAGSPGIDTIQGYSPAIGGAPGTDALAAVNDTFGDTALLVSVMRKRRITAVSAATPVIMVYRGDAGAGAQERWLTAIPVRVG